MTLQLSKQWESYPLFGIPAKTYGGGVGAILNTVWITVMIRRGTNSRATATCCATTTTHTRHSPPPLLPCTLQVMNIVYFKIAKWLNDKENHRTETEHEDQLIIKTFLFQFFNSCAFGRAVNTGANSRRRTRLPRPLLAHPSAPPPPLSTAGTPRCSTLPSSRRPRSPSSAPSATSTCPPTSRTPTCARRRAAPTSRGRDSRGRRGARRTRSTAATSR